MKHVFIVNVSVTGKKAAEVIEKISAICHNLKVDFVIQASTSKKETQYITQKYKDEFATIYAVGGDGSVNAVLNSLVGGKAFLGIVPFGSGNDFYKTLSDYDDVVVSTNVMKVNDMYCLNIFSAGIDAEICEAANKMKGLNISKKQVYNVGMLYAFLKHKDEPMIVNVDGVNYYDPKMTLVAVCNGKYYGNGYKIAPQADIKTMNASVLMVGDLGKLKMPMFLRSVIKGTHEQKENVVKVLGRNIESLWGKKCRNCNIRFYVG